MIEGEKAEWGAQAERRFDDDDLMMTLRYTVGPRDQLCACEYASAKVLPMPVNEF